MPRAKRRLVLGLIAGALCLAYADRVAFSLALDPIRDEMHLSDARLGALGGLAFAVLYALAAVPLARAADAGHRRTVIVGAILCWSLFTALTGRAANFLQLLGARIGVGIGEAGATPAALSLVASLFPPASRAGALATCWFGAYLGLVLGLWGGGALVQSFGWRPMLGAAAIPGLPLAAGLLLVLPRSAAAPRGTRADVLAPWRSPVFHQLFLFSATGGFVSWGALLWDATFYERSFGMSPAQAGFWLGGALGLATAAGTLASGPVGDRLARSSDRATPLRFAGWALLASQPFAVACYAVHAQALSLACMVITTSVGALTVGPVQSALQGCVAERSRATASAFYGIGGALLGAGFGPPAFGLLSDLLAPHFGAQSLRVALILSALLGLWPALHLLAAARRQRATPA